MENKLIDKMLHIISYIVLVAVLVFGIITLIDDNQASAQELDTITLKAGTYRFNDVLTFEGFGLEFINDTSTSYKECDFRFGNLFSIPDYTFTPDSSVADYINNLAVNLGLNGDVVANTTYTIETSYNLISLVQFADAYAMWYYFDPFINGRAIVTPTSEALSAVLNTGTNSSQSDEAYYAGLWQSTRLNGSYQIVTIPECEVEKSQGNWFISNTNYNEVNNDNSLTIPYTDVFIPTDIQIMENINMDINGFGSTMSNDNVGITALNGDTLGRLRTNDGTTIAFNGIAVTSFDSWRTISTYVYPLTDHVIATSPFTISNGLMLYVWDDTQYYQVAWFNPADRLWYVHSDYAIIVPYGQRSTTSIGTLRDGIAISLSITPNLTSDDLGYVELGGFEDTPPYDNIITVADEDAYSTFAMFCNANYISDSEKLAWGIAQHQSGQNLGQSQQLGDNILGQFLQAPIDILDSIVIYTTPNGTAVTLMGVFGALLTLSLVIIFLKLFAGG